MSQIKITLLSYLILAAAITAGCKKEIERPTAGSAVVADFATSETITEVYDSISFTSLTKNAARLEWDFGDFTFSQDSVVTKKYASAGIYHITLTAYDASGRSSQITKTLLAGERRITSAMIKRISFTDVNGQPWDIDGTGPDVILFIGKIGGTASGNTVANNATPGMFPIRVNAFGPSYLKDELYDIFFQEQNPFNNHRIMASWTVNPAKLGKPDANGHGSFTLTSGQYEVEINYEVK